MLTKEQAQGKKDAVQIQLPSLEELDKSVADLDAKVREIKERVDIFESNHEAQTAAKQLQDATRQVLHRRYGPDDVYRYRVVVDLEFQSTIKDFAEHGSAGSFTIELAPSSLQPHSIHTCLEIARQWHRVPFIASHLTYCKSWSRLIPCPIWHSQNIRRPIPTRNGRSGTLDDHLDPRGMSASKTIPRIMDRDRNKITTRTRRIRALGRSWRDTKNTCFASKRWRAWDSSGMRRSMS